MVNKQQIQAAHKICVNQPEVLAWLPSPAFLCISGLANVLIVFPFDLERLVADARSSRWPEVGQTATLQWVKTCFCCRAQGFDEQKTGENSCHCATKRLNDPNVLPTPGKVAPEHWSGMGRQAGNGMHRLHSALPESNLGNEHLQIVSFPLNYT